MSDEETPCSWYSIPEIQGGGYCGSGGCSMLGDCPVDSCDGILTNVTAQLASKAPTGAPSIAPTAPDGVEEDIPETDKPSSTPVEVTDEPSSVPVEVEGEVEVTTPTSSPTVGTTLVALTPGAEGGDSPCNAITGGCEECLTSEDECAWTAEKCLPGCTIADASCFTVADFSSMTESEICAIAANTTDQPFTGPAAGMDDAGPCNGLPDCDTCLTVRMDCAWIADSCQDPSTCIAVSDDECFHPSKYPNMTGPEICVIAVEGSAGMDDASPCNGLLDCATCLTVRMDCAWIADSCQDPSTCIAVAEDECFHPSKYPNMTGPEICMIAAEEGSNATSGGSIAIDATDDSSSEVSKTISSASMPGRYAVLPGMVALVALLHLVY
jgi:hypothetical protein